jgi:outer membrane protein assembly factor BamB/orotate phosphoribosyltransferase
MHHSGSNRESAPLTLARAETHYDILEAILRQAVRKRDRGDVLISPEGKLLAWLIDLRPLFLDKSFLMAVCDSFWETHQELGPFQLAGMETAAIPLLTALLLTAPEDRAVNGFIVRKDRKHTGLGNIIEGKVTKDPVILVDDLINSGSSAEKARVAIDRSSGKIQELFVVIDYLSRKGLKWRSEHSIQVRPLFSLSDLGLTLSTPIHTPLQKYTFLWRTIVEGGFAFHVVPKSTPLLVGSRIYRGCDAGKMHAFDADTGAIVWEFQATGAVRRKGIWSSPAFHNNRIYFGAYNGVVYCLDANTGEEVWSRSDGEWIGSSPLIVPRHQLFYIGLEYQRPWAQGSVAAFDLSTGEKVWEGMTKKLQHGSAAYWNKGDLILWGTADHQMMAVHPKSGEIIWSFATERSVKYAPCVDEERGLVAFASFDKCIYVLDVATGRERGRWITNDICYTTPLITGDRLFCGSGDRHLYVIDLNRMELIKRLEMDARVYSSPRLVGDRVIVGTNGGRVVEIDVNSLEIKGSLQLPDAITNAIAVSHDGQRIYVSTYMNDLYCFRRL